MNEPKVTDLDYINFLLAAPRVMSCAEAARVQPDGPDRAAHDALNRLLTRLEPDTGPLWQEAEPLVDRTQGRLISDDSAARSAQAQRNHIGWGLRAYLRLIWHELETGATRFATKLDIIRPAVQHFLSDPSAILAGFSQVGMAHKRSTA